MKHNYLLKLSGFCGILLFVVAIITLVFSILDNPWFNWTDYAISDLGSSNGSLIFFNGGVILQGVLLLFFSLGFIKNSDDNNPGPRILLISSYSLIGVGMFPLPSPIHFPVSCIFFISFTLSFLVFGLYKFKKSISFMRTMKIFAFVVTLYAFVSPLFLLFFTGVAISEMFIIFPGFLWCMVYSCKMLIE